MFQHLMKDREQYQEVLAPVKTRGLPSDEDILGFITGGEKPAVITRTFGYSRVLRRRTLIVGGIDSEIKYDM